MKLRIKATIKKQAETEAENPRELLMSLGLLKLRQNINQALNEFSISWKMPSPSSKETLVDFVDELCNEFRLGVSDTGKLFKKL